jgi:hypothetical protein
MGKMTACRPEPKASKSSAIIDDTATMHDGEHDGEHGGDGGGEEHGGDGDARW